MSLSGLAERCRIVCADRGIGEADPCTASPLESRCYHHRPRQQSGSPHQVAQKNPVPEPGAKLRPERGGLVTHGEQSTGNVKRPGVGCGVGEILSQANKRHQAHDADQMRIDSTVREAMYPRATLSLTRFSRWGKCMIMPSQRATAR
jgi:hypothetical protein